MPSLNHLIIKVYPRMFKILFGSTLFNRWFSSSGGNTKSFKESFKESFKGTIGKSYVNRNFLKTATVDASSFTEEPHFCHMGNLDSCMYCSGKTATAVSQVGEPCDDALYSPIRLGRQFRKGDLESGPSGMPN
jgi:hypothetical protein